MRHIRLFENFSSEEPESDDIRVKDDSKDMAIRRVTPDQDVLDFKKYFIDRYSMILADIKPSN